MTLNEAQAEFEWMMDLDFQGAIKRFYQFHYNQDRLMDLTTDDAHAILNELDRSRARTQSSHALWKPCINAVKAIDTWKGPDEHWEASRKRRLMPFLPTRQSLAALRYLRTEDPDIPTHLLAQFKTVDLDWYLLDQAPSAWWNGVSLDDEDWRKTNMVEPPWHKRVHFTVAEDVLRLSKLLLENNIKPKGVVDHSRPSRQESSRRQKSKQKASAKRKSSVKRERKRKRLRRRTSSHKSRSKRKCR